MQYRDRDSDAAGCGSVVVKEAILCEGILRKKNSLEE